VEFNQKYAAVWPRLTYKKDPPVDADQWRDVPHKLKDYFNPEPAEGSESNSRQ
jgi:ferredoxin